MPPTRAATTLRVTFVVGAITVTAVLTMAAMFLVVVHSPRIDGWLVAPSLALVGTLIGPLVLGALLAFWDVESSTEARRFYRRALSLVVGIQVIAAVAMTVYCAVADAPIWMAVAFTGVGIGLTAAAVTIGPAAQRAEERRAVGAHAAWQPYTSPEFRSDLRKAAWTATITFVVTAALIVVMVISLGIDVWNFIAWPLIFAVISVGIVCTLVVFRLAQRQRDAVGTDLGRVRMIGKAVLRGKSDELSEADQPAAAKFADLSWVTQGYQLASQTCIYVALSAMQIFSLTSGIPNPFTGWILALFVLLWIVTTPIAIIQLRRTRRYAEGHRELIA
ncbi:hypothetical protein [Microbacterium sp. SLBN-146]|uniref:hypothetical protein n=1 Tax=Microbacterium sp. SLBN-146 TaxID=2768457 RepID=UPI00114F363C|nr:hypothetical protein [Microbacterium sp. SLBN-146]TQJ32641.1 hypothetical protein FBY39_3155 [Microbacterium sp. SLBN-146]